MDAATVTILCSSLASLVVLVLGYLREGRAHRWQVEQSDRDKTDRLLMAEDLKAHAETNSRAVTENTRRGVAVLSHKIDENTEISVKAFNEANNVNEKIAAIGAARLRGADKNRHE